MAYSIYTAYGDGVTNQFTISFGLGYIDKADVKCRVNKEVDGLGQPSYRPLTWVTDSLVQVGGTVPANGNLVEFIRTVSKTSLVHDYSDGVEIQEKNLDDSNKQTLMAVQEVLDGRFESGLATDLDFANHNAINLAAGTNPNDAVTLTQLQDMTGNAPAYAAAAAASASTATTQAGIATTKAAEALSSANSAAASAAGMKLKSPARAATTAALPSCTYNNGASGVGATLTATANGALIAQDGVTLLAGEALLVKNQAASAQNGIYVVTQVGSGGTPWILTRQADSDTWAEVYAALVTVAEGTALADTDFLCTSNNGGTMGATAITWQQRNAVIADGAVSTTTKIVDGIITYAKIATASIASVADITGNVADKLVNAVTFKSYMDTYIFGKGQTWQDMSASRVIGTTYTNSTGRPIMVNASFTFTDDGINLEVGGVVACSCDTGSGTGILRLPMSIVVPDGATYRAVAARGAATINTWTELR